MTSKKCVKSKDFNQHCTEFKMTDKSSIKITLSMLEKLHKQAEQAEKIPLLVFGVRRNDTDVFIITGELSIEKQKCSKRKQ